MSTRSETFLKNQESQEMSTRAEAAAAELNTRSGAAAVRHSFSRHRVNGVARTKIWHIGCLYLALLSLSLYLSLAPSTYFRLV